MEEDAASFYGYTHTGALSVCRQSRNERLLVGHLEKNAASVRAPLKP